MADINIQPRTPVYGPNGGFGEAAGFNAVSSDGTKAIAGGAGWYQGPLGATTAGAGVIAAGPQNVAGAGVVCRDGLYVEGAAAGAFNYDKTTGELDAGGAATWTNKATGETHSGEMIADLQKGQGGTVTVSKDGASKIITIPPRPTLA
jgi:hypothetical protein